MRSFVNGFSYGMYYMKLIYKTVSSSTSVNHISGLLPIAVCQYLTPLVAFRIYVERKVKRAKTSENLRKALNAPTAWPATSHRPTNALFERNGIRLLK